MKTKKQESWWPKAAELNLSDVRPEKGSQIENNLIREPYWGLYNAYYLH